MSELAKQLKEAAAAVKGLPPELRPVAFQFLLDHIQPTKPSTLRKRTRRGKARQGATAVGGASTKSTRRPARSPRVLDLKLPRKELTQFAKKKAPSNHQERYTVAAAFLRDKTLADRVGVNEIFTVYRLLKWKLPGRDLNGMQQVFRDAMRHKGWFDEADSEGRRALTYVGEEFVTHDLPTKPSAEEG